MKNGNHNKEYSDIIVDRLSDMYGHEFSVLYPKGMDDINSYPISQ
jgi:hypothetical protein